MSGVTRIGEPAETMTALKDLLGSERGLIGLLLIICCTVLAAMNRMTFDDWQSYTMWIFGIYVGGKTITGAVQIAKGKTEPDLSSMSEADMVSMREKGKQLMKTLYGLDIDEMNKDTEATKARTAELQKMTDELKTATDAAYGRTPPVTPPGA